MKKSKLGGENSKTFSTENNKAKEKISLNTKIKKPINGGGARTLGDKNSFLTESRKYLTEKNPTVMRQSINEKLKDADHKDEKLKKGNHKDNKELNKNAALTKSNIKKDKSKSEIEIKKKDVDTTHLKTKKELHEPIVNPFPDQTKVEVIDIIEPPSITMEVEIPVEVVVEKTEIALTENLNLSNNIDITSAEANVDLTSKNESVPIVVVEENSENPTEEKSPELEN